MDRDLSGSHDGRDLPEGWVVWSEEDGLVVVYKPDVFDASSYPRPCLPTVTVSRADVGTVGDRDGWRVSFYIEADVEAYELGEVLLGYGDAVDYVVEVTSLFNSGELDFEGFYAEGDVRVDYVERLREEIPG